MQELFDAVRAACPTGIWSKAVELVRVFAVTQQSGSDDEIECRVRQSDQAVPATVHLYPEDAEWDCDCASRAPCCEHVAAAVIALKKARAEGKPLAAAMSSAANLGYRFSRAQGELRVERVIVKTDGTKIPLRVSLTSVVKDHAAGLDITATDEDLNLDRLIGSSAILRPDQVLGVLKLLAGHKNLEFEGKVVEVSLEPARPHAVITSSDGTFVVRLGPDPAVREIVASHVGLTDRGFVPLGATEFCGPKYEKLTPERRYEPGEVATLVGEVLPELRRWFAVDLQTDRLPEVTADERPRVLLEVQQSGSELSIVPTLVYGDPPIARVHRNQLVHLSGPVPARKLELERRAQEHLRQSLGLVVGVRSSHSGKEAIQFAHKLDHWHGEILGYENERWVEEVTLCPELFSNEHLPRFMARTADRELVATSEATVKAYREGLSFAPLIGGGFARMPLDWLGKHADLLERLLRSDLGDVESATLSPDLAALRRALRPPSS